MSLPFLATLSSLVYQRLNADAYFSDIALFEDARGVVAEEVAQAMGGLTLKDGKAGAVVVIRFPTYDANTSQTPSGELKALVVVDIHVDPIVNNSTIGTGKTTDEIWTMCARLLNTFRTSLFNRTLTLDPKPMEAVTYETGELSCKLKLRTDWALEALNKVMIAGLQIESLGSNQYRARVTAATTGAQVVFKATPVGDIPVVPTLDNATPVSVNEWQTLTITEESNIVAVGYKEGMTASDDLSALLSLEAILPVVSNIASPSATGTTLSLTWECDVATSTYEIQVRLSTAEDWTSPIGGTLTSDTEAKVITGLTYNTSYDVRIRAVGGEWVEALVLLTSFPDFDIATAPVTQGDFVTTYVTGPDYSAEAGHASASVEVTGGLSGLQQSLPAPIGEQLVGNAPIPIEITMTWTNAQRTKAVTQTVQLLG